MNLDAEHLVLPFGLVLMRVGTFVATCPVFVPDTVSTALRAALALILSLSLTFSLEHFVVPSSLMCALFNEMLLGGMMAASVRLTATAIGFAGELFDINLGYSFARTMNPMMGEEATPLMHLSQLMSTILFLLADGQRMVIIGLTRSLQIFAPGSGGFHLAWARVFAGHLSEVVQAGLLLAVPIVLAMLCTQLALALLSRLAPSLNIWAIGLLGTCGMGLIALWCFLPAWVEAMLRMWRSVDPFVDLLRTPGSTR